MATDPTENPSDHQRLEAADAKRKRKQEIDKKSREKKKKKLENNEAQLKTLQDECNYYKGQLDLCKKSMMKPLLDEACQIGKFVQELGESRGHTRDTVEKQTDMVNQFWDIIKPLPGGSGSISASTDKDAYPPLELSVAAIKSDGSVTTESFKPCQSLPEEWTQLAMGGQERLIRAFFGLREHYTATTAHHAREIADRDQELINLKEELARAEAMPYKILFEEKEPPEL
ncbi:uncharacterized protein LOC7453923 isoform X6 [Populus trichocarpa]|uniref:BZIP domain-containing protein n=1 Tax=Populus trichocarpa TaxID=3694 RepID=A0A3N7ENG3_POPTR|nr:uncharacterized protein LOC7453923 isoform X6 [Populus trichocarpa]|eukprot:XP_024450436.1 uncharacterized protein LOC7453923 isoform X3 [Populus trichocarpa]